MHVVEATQLGSFEHYEVVERPQPKPGAGELLIEVRACGIGYGDALMALGRYQVKPKTPHTPGGEVAGVVVALGSDVTGFAPGDRVMAHVSGGMAEYVVAAADRAWPVPPGVRLEQAAALRINYLTALHGLRSRAQIRPGERLLVTGAAGGVGAAAVQIGRLLNAEVIATGSTEAKRDAARSSGAAIVLDTSPDGWRERLAAAAPGGVDVVFDTVCGPLFEPAFRSLRWGGRHLVVGFVHGEIPALPANLPLLKGAALVGVDVTQYLTREPDAAAKSLAQVLSWTAAGDIAPVVGSVFPMSDAQAALSAAFSGRGIGKVVLQVGRGAE
jgi:NADPH2:quinone reductase